MLKRHKTLTALTCAAFLAMGFTSTQAESKLLVDKDDDQRISQDEFASSSKPHLTTADDDKDGYLSDVEMIQATFRAWDKDGNGEIIPAEFNDGRDTMAEDRAERMTFKIWDKNNDNEVHLDEFKEGIAKTGLYTNVYTTPETRVKVIDYQTYVFGYYDANKNGYIDANEMPARGPLYIVH